MKRRASHPLKWLLEPLSDLPGYMEKPMFGCLACYVRGRLSLVLASREEPWDGILVPLERDAHSSMMSEFPGLSPHPVLGKWLYLPLSYEGFEEVAGVIVERIADGDVRIGIEPKERAANKKRVSTRRLKKS